MENVDPVNPKPSVAKTRSSMGRRPFRPPVKEGTRDSTLLERGQITPVPPLFRSGGIISTPTGLKRLKPDEDSSSPLYSPPTPSTSSPLYRRATKRLRQTLSSSDEEPETPGSQSTPRLFSPRKRPKNLFGGGSHSQATSLEGENRSLGSGAQHELSHLQSTSYRNFNETDEFEDSDSNASQDQDELPSLKSTANNGANEFEDFIPNPSQDQDSSPTDTVATSNLRKPNNLFSGGSHSHVNSPEVQNHSSGSGTQHELSHLHSTPHFNCNKTDEFEDSNPNPLQDQDELPLLQSTANNWTNDVEDFIPNPNQDQDSSPTDTVAPSNQRKKVRVRRTTSKSRLERKLARNAGEEYVTQSGKLIPKRKAEPLSKCRNMCMEKISDEDGAELCDSIWKGLCSANARRAYIGGQIHVNPKKTSSLNSKNERNRQFTYTYHACVKGVNVVVCKTCFKKIYKVSNKFIEVSVGDKLKNPGGIQTQDRRGAARSSSLPETKIEEVISHINSFPRYKSHYGRNKTEKEFLPSHLTLKLMYEEYTGKVEKPVSRWIYEREFNKMGLKIKPLKIDTCHTCDTVKCPNFGQI
ncbi:Nitrate reductase [NADPH] [Frankliniella fusca]|uniref:Nitrate reductase [NADPH] n=1 Tax=Frankliniella fusca TaxID=407009 RepID=A0AAE1GY69_9NEOP|nr:Nitrate reductase [NADPH] [Frankliniella fusca]